MTKELASFFAQAAATPALAEKLQATNSLRDIATLAQAQGFTVTETDLAAATTSISDEDLEAVAGGKRLAPEELTRQLEELTRVRTQASARG